MLLSAKDFFFDLAPSSAPGLIRNSEDLMDELMSVPPYLERLTFQEKLKLQEDTLAPSGYRPCVLLHTASPS